MLKEIDRFVISKEAHSEMLRSVSACSVFSLEVAIRDPSSAYWWQVSDGCGGLRNATKDDLPVEWNKAQIDEWEAVQQRLTHKWKEYRKMKEEGNAPQSVGAFCGFLFHDDGAGDAT